MVQNKNLSSGKYEPKKCWVGEGQKICFNTIEEAEMAARVAEYDHGISGLSVYKCEYGNHYHLTTSGGNGTKI